MSINVSEWYHKTQITENINKQDLLSLKVVLLLLKITFEAANN